MAITFGLMPRLSSSLLEHVAALDTLSAACLGTLIGGVAMVALLKHRRRAALLAASGLTAVLMVYGAGQASLLLLRGVRAPAQIEDESLSEPEPRIAYAVADPSVAPTAGESSASPAAAGAGC